MNLQENIHRIKTMMGLIIEEEGKSNYKGTNRIILLGPPTVGKSTICEELGKKLKLEVISLDKNQKKFGGFGEKNEVACVKWALSNKVNTPSIIDFGGGQVYWDGVKELLKDYKNIFVLIPSEDYDLSQELLKANHQERLKDNMIVPITFILKCIESPDCEFDEKKKNRVIKVVKKIIDGGAGKIEPIDIPKKAKDKFGFKHGFEASPGWNKYSNLYTKKHDKINRSITDNTIEVYTEKGNRRSKSVIVNDIIKLLK
jgi:broad-specificity NMP kinase